MIDLFLCRIVSALFFAVIFCVDMWKKQLPIRRVLMFRIFLFAMLLNTVSAIAADLSVKYVASVFWTEMIEAAYMFMCLVCCLLLHCFILSLAYQLHPRLSVPGVSGWACLAGGIYTLISAVFFFSSPWNHLCFYLRGNSVVKMPGFYVVCAFLFMTLLYDSLVLVFQCRKYSVRKRMMCGVLAAVFFLMVLAEVVPSLDLPFVKIFPLFFVYMFYLSLQSPDFYVDAATGKFNRNGFIEVFEERLAYHKKTSCLLVRVRNYHSMNQIYGSEVLRVVQRRIGKILEKLCSERRIYHIGSSTYAIVGDSREEIRALYEKCLGMIPGVWTVAQQVVNHEYSFYEISYPQDGEDFEELIQRMHYARSDHSSTHAPGALVHLRSDVMERSEEKKEVARLVEEAIMDNSIELHFQPIFSFEKGKITSLEVLARLKDKDKKYINPELFIHVAEENHTIIQLGEQIFRKACVFASNNRIFDYGIEDININLSPAQCQYENLTEDLVKIAGRYGISMTKMHLEITESEFTDKEAVGRTLSRLKKTGAKVALDDFGTGNSTLSNILELPVDFVKIDKSLVWSFAEGKNQFLNELMPMIKAEGKKIIAEGIETADHIDIIKKLQGDYLQGYYYSRPLPEKEFMRYLKRFNGREKNHELQKEAQVVTG